MTGLACHYCRRQMIDPKLDKSGRRANLSVTRDHITPKCRGGRRTVLCCRQCNGLKADLSPELWSLVMRRHPTWWKKFHSGAEVRNIALDLTSESRRKRAVWKRLKRCPIKVPPPPLCRGLAA